MRALALALLLTAPPAVAQTVSAEFVRAVFVTLGAEDVELLAEPEPAVVEVLGADAALLGVARITERGGTETAVFARFDEPAAAVGERYRDGAVEGWTVTRVRASERGRRATVEACADADGTRVSIGLVDRPGGGSYAIAGAEAGAGACEPAAQTPAPRPR